jgi:hypothetical protein
MQDSVLETLLVVNFTTKMSAQSLRNFIVKFGFKAEICWKLEELKWNLNNSEVSSYLFGTYITFLKAYDAGYWINTKIINNLQLWNIFLAKLVNSGGAAGE